jgi:hypothetical protein
MHTPSTEAARTVNISNMPKANDIQVGGDHYKKDRTGLQHWDVVDLLGWDYFQGNITKYVDRHAKKKGFEDLEKAEHYLHKYMELKYPDEYAAREAAKPKPLDTYTAHELMEELRRRAHEQELEAMHQYLEDERAQHRASHDPDTVEPIDPCKECGFINGHHSECSQYIDQRED